MSEEVKKHPWGRPTTYSEDMVQKVYDYINQCDDEYIDYIKSQSDWERSSSWSREQKIKVNIPTIEWLAKYLNVAVSSVHKRREHEEFSESLDDLLADQKDKLIKMSLWWYYNPTISKLMLWANHGMKEITVQENTWKDWWPIQIEDLSWKSTKEIEEARRKILW